MSWGVLKWRDCHLEICKGKAPPQRGPRGPLSFIHPWHSLIQKDEDLMRSGVDRLRQFFDRDPFTSGFSNQRDFVAVVRFALPDVDHELIHADAPNN